MGGTSTPVLSVKNIHTILPHRFPFLLVDRIESFDLERKTIVGKKNVTVNEWFFQGHFPEAPLMPGVLIIEALAQTGGVLVHLLDNKGRIAILLGVNEAKFRKPVRPGDQVLLQADLLHLSSKAGKVRAQASVDDVVVAQAELTFALMEKAQI